MGCVQVDHVSRDTHMNIHDDSYFRLDTEFRVKLIFDLQSTETNICLGNSKKPKLTSKKVIHLQYSTFLCMCVGHEGLEN